LEREGVPKSPAHHVEVEGVAEVCIPEWTPESIPESILVKAAVAVVVAAVAIWVVWCT
jgi:hypothetical protein